MGFFSMFSPIYSYEILGQSLASGIAPVSSVQSDLVAAIPNAKIFNILTNSWETLQADVNNQGIQSDYPNLNTYHNFGIELRLMKLLTTKYQSPQYLYKYTYPGSGMEVGSGNNGNGRLWKVSVNDLYANSNTSHALANQTIPPNNSFRAVIWMQGEADTLDSSYASTYQTNLTAFIAAKRIVYGNPKLVFILKTLGDTQIALDSTNKATVNAAMFAIAAADPYVKIASGDGLGVLADNTHLNASGNDVFAQRVYDILISL